MNIPIEVPGLDTIIPDIQEGKMVIVESGADSAKSFFVRRLSLTAGRIGWPVSFVTSRDPSEVRALLTAEGGKAMPSDDWVKVYERDELDDFEEFEGNGGLLTVDSYSFLTLNVPPPKLATSLRQLHSACRNRGMTALLATDRGMFDPRSEAVATHLADGFLQFHARESADGVQRFLRIPKWMDGRFVDRNIYYEFDGRRIAVDLRNRVL